MEDSEEHRCHCAQLCGFLDMAPSTEATLPSTMSRLTGNTTHTIVPLIVPAVSHSQYFLRKAILCLWLRIRKKTPRRESKNDKS